MDSEFKALIAAILFQVLKDIKNLDSSGYAKMAAYRYTLTEDCMVLCEAINQNYNQYRKKASDLYFLQFQEEKNE